MIATAKVSGLDDIFRQANRFYGKVLTANNEVADFARQLILDRVATGKTTEGKTMAFKNTNDRYYRGSKSKKSGDYSLDYVNRTKRSDKPMNLNLTGGLYKSFQYRKKSGKVFSLDFFIKKNRNSRYKKDYTEIANYSQYRFGAIFNPSKKEANVISRAWRNRLK